MKEVITVKMVEQTTVKYVADDGKTFDKEVECKRYELEKRTNEVKKRFGCLDKTSVDIPVIDGYKGEGCVYKITFYNREDVNALVDYYIVHRFYMDYVYDQVEKIKSFPYTTIVDEGYDSICFLDEDILRRDVEKMLSQLDSHNNKTISMN